jgi:hypothetical protein
MSKVSRFQKYYSIPENKKKHDDYCLERVECPCGTITARSNLGHHRKTAKHKKWIKDNKYVLEISELKKDLIKLRDEFKVIKKTVSILKNQ